MPSPGAFSTPASGVAIGDAYACQDGGHHELQLDRVSTRLTRLGVPYVFFRASQVKLHVLLPVAGFYIWSGGVFILGFFFGFFLIFFRFWLLRFWLLGFLASWLLGFLASRLLGFLASRLLGFLASRLLGFWASWLFGFLASWLLGFLAFRLLGFSASGLLGFSAFCWFMRLLVAFWLFASSAFPVPLRLPPPPTPPLRFRFSAEI